MLEAADTIARKAMPGQGENHARYGYSCRIQVLRAAYARPFLPSLELQMNCGCSGIDIWCYNPLVRSKASHLIVTLILSICVVCPLIEMFDRWDNTAQTGNDTEYAFVILGLCVGVSYTFASAVLRTSESSRSRRAAGTDGFLPTCFRSSLNLIVTPVSASPPLSTLRI
jgi:hypothetical protein